ncbi:unnamed protein product [Diatraea saccharalis]|uniref:Uncharacterized protein n=1 Tax=Diatraea saccharalis TaxID=40085 RepID=A0A9N9WEI0_9NEOP|nr:unnamed protein product [Diatraea saccharalis]
MISSTISKIKQVCTLAFIPRLFRGDIRSTLGKFEKLSLFDQKRAHNTTKTECSLESEKEKCQHIIDLVFAPNVPFTETIFTELDTKSKGLTYIVSSRRPPNEEDKCEICRRLIKEIFGDDNNDVVDTSTIVQKNQTQIETLQATTNKVNEEKLVQKIEIIEETPLVEAQKPKIEGFNVLPKILGRNNQEEKVASTKNIETLCFSSRKNTSNHSKNSIIKGSPDFDELAQRCLNSPSGRIDERLLKEMEKLGVPPTSGRESKKKIDDNEFSQAEIMKKPRRPVEKTDLDLTNIQNQDTMGEKIELPSPFGLTTGKYNSDSIKVDSKRVGFMNSHKERGQAEYSSSKEIERRFAKGSYKHITPKNEMPYNQLLSHMFATNVPTDETIKSTNSPDNAGQRDNKSNLRHINIVEHISVTIEEPVHQVHEHHNENNAGNQEHYEIKDSSLVEPEKTTESINRQIIQNLLQTRVEHLVHDKIKSLKLLPDDSNLNSKVNAFQFSDQNQSTDGNFVKGIESQVTGPLVICKETMSGQVDGTTNEFTKIEDAYVKDNTEFTTKDDSIDELELAKVSEQTDDIYDTFIGTESTRPTLEYNIVESQPDEHPNQILVAENNLYKNYNYNIQSEIQPLIESKEDERNINVKENDKFTNIEPVIVAETGRLQIKGLIFSPDKQINTSTTIKDSVTPNIIPPEKLVKPLIDKGTLIDVPKESFENPLPTVDFPKSKPQEAVSLSELLKKVRARNRIEYCRGVELHMKTAPNVDPAVGKCGKKPPKCPPAAPQCPPKKPQCPPPPAPPCPPCPPPPEPPCPPPKAPCPNPCKPKCSPPCTPNPCAPKPSCPPAKKNPCDKFISIGIHDTLILLVYYGPQFHIPRKSMLPIITCKYNIDMRNELKDEIALKLQNISNKLMFPRIQAQNEILPPHMILMDNIEYSRTYDPWVPIPSWPIPEKQSKKDLVCPKHGCKDAPPRLNPPCSDIHPCQTLPKPNSLPKRSFSAFYNFLIAFTTCS